MEQTLEEKLRRVTNWHAPLARGGMSWAGLRALASRIGTARGVEIVVAEDPWPFSGSLQRVGDRLVIKVDSRRNLAERTYALAHEVGHLALGHYDIHAREVWYHTDGPNADELEAEADVFAGWATRTPGTLMEWFQPERLKQMRLAARRS